MPLARKELKSAIRTSKNKTTGTICSNNPVYQHDLSDHDSYCTYLGHRLEQTNAPPIAKYTCLLHSHSEYLSIASLKRNYKYLKEFKIAPVKQYLTNAGKLRKEFQALIAKQETQLTKKIMPEFKAELEMFEDKIQPKIMQVWFLFVL